MVVVAVQNGGDVSSIFVFNKGCVKFHYICTSRSPTPIVTKTVTRENEIDSDKKAFLIKT